MTADGSTHLQREDCACEPFGSAGSERPAIGGGSFKKEAEFARHLLRQRRKREELLGKELFAEPAWDMMLDLFASAIEGKRVAKSSLVIASAVPQSTAIRWMGELVEAGMIKPYPDTADGRRTFMELCDGVVERIAEVLRGWMCDRRWQSQSE